MWPVHHITITITMATMMMSMTTTMINISIITVIITFIICSVIEIFTFLVVTKSVIIHYVTYLLSAVVARERLKNTSQCQVS